MLHARAARFDVTGNIKFLAKLFGTKQSQFTPKTKTFQNFYHIESCSTCIEY